MAGTRTVSQAGDLHLTAISNDGIPRLIVINNVLYDEESTVNLLSGDQLRACGFSVRIEPSDKDCCIILNSHSSNPITFPLKCENKNFSLYVPTSMTEETNVPHASTAHKSMSLFAGNMSLEELTHLRMNHASNDKCVEQSKRVDGMKRVLERLKLFKGPCHCCQDAKATRNDYPPATETWTDWPDRWNMDMFNMGESFTTIHGNRYATMVVIHKSRFGVLFLHKDRSAAMIQDILEDAFAQAGVRPKILRSDGAEDTPVSSKILD